jgi:acylphosphatase
VRNIDDGSVEVLICGGEDPVRQMLEWLQAGPPMAEVEVVSLAQSDCPVLAGFNIVS